MFCSGLLHISNITHGQLKSVRDVLEVGESVKALVIKSSVPDRIALRYNRLYLELLYITLFIVIYVGNLVIWFLLSCAHSLVLVFGSMQR
jgi:hypothetical protein